MKQLLLRDSADIQTHLETIRQTTQATLRRFLESLDPSDPFDALFAMKFDPIGRDPLDLNRPLHLIEQINQAATYVVSLHGAKHLFDVHPGQGPFRLNLGTQSGSDIESTNGLIAAEVFAAVDPRNNRKLHRDIKKVQGTDAQWKYVFFASRVESRIPIVEGVRIVRFSMAQVLSPSLRITP